MSKNESSRYLSLLLRSLRHLDEQHEPKPGDIRLPKTELLSQLEILNHPDSFTHLLACHVADVLHLPFADVRRLADLGDLGPQYNANSRFPKTDLPRIQELPLPRHYHSLPITKWQDIYEKAIEHLLLGNLEQVGWDLERIKRRDYTAYL